MAQRLFLIDGSSNIFRAFYAIRNLSNSKGEPTNAVYGFIQMLRKLLRDEAPDLVGVALDISRQTVRSERFAEYKANRKPMPDDLRSQMPWIRRSLEAYRIPILEYEGYEADDVLGTLARAGAEAGYEVVLISADKDLMQLVGDGVFLHHTGRDKLYDADGVREDFGVAPERVIDVLALMGDASDNVPGVPGIGEKGAKTLVNDFGSLEALLERAEEVKRKSYREGLQEHRDLAELSKELVTIHRDLPLEFDPEALRYEAPDVEALRSLLSELEFYSLLDELESGGEALEIDPAEVVGTPDAWRAATKDLPAEVVVALVGPPEKPCGVAVQVEEGRTIYGDFRGEGLREVVRETLRTLLADGDRRLVGHDLKEILRLAGVVEPPAARLVDLMLISYLLRSAHGHSLEELALEKLDYKALEAKEVGWARGKRPAADAEVLAAYASERVLLCAALEPGLSEDLGDGRLAEIYREIEEPLIAVLVSMEEHGVLLDVPFLQAMSAELGGELEALESEIYELADETFNINSAQQLGVILFEKLGYPVLKRTRKTKSYSTGADVLEELARRGYPLPEKILEYREINKLKSTYVDALPALVAEDGRVHTHFNQAVAATGRLSSNHPNLQNIPVRTERGQQIRRAFVAPPGHCLLVADYSQIELRVLAHIAGEDALVKAFRAGEDIHASTAATVFGLVPELVTAEQRRAAKTINFGIIYGISGFGLAQNLGITPKEAEEFIAAYLDRFPKVRAYMDETLESAQQEGKVETLSGRIRWLPDIRSKNYNLRENARRMAINARIQGTAADLMKQAMIAVDRQLRLSFPAARLLLTVHDELVLEVPEDEVEEVSAMVRREMEGVAELAVPLVVDAASGESWYEAKG